MKYKVVKTDAKTRWDVAVVATFGKGTLYRAVVAGTKHEVATASRVYWFYNVRTASSPEWAATPRT